MLTAAALRAMTQPLRPLARAACPELEQLGLVDSNVPRSVVDLLVSLDGRTQADCLEIGLCLAGTALCRMTHLAPIRNYVAVDPYGNLPYADARRSEPLALYGDGHERHALANYFVGARRTNVGAQYWRLTSWQWFNYIAPLGFVRHGIHRPYRFGSMLLDGSHESAVVAGEIGAVLPYLIPDGVIVVDNADYPQADGSCLAAGILDAVTTHGLTCAFFESTTPDETWNPVAVIARTSDIADGLRAAPAPIAHCLTCGVALVEGADHSVCRGRA
jgi:hypothetical protein